MSELAASCGGQLHGADARFAGAAIDSRTLGPGSLFVALPGERVDGHEFVAAAFEAGAAGALVARRMDCPLSQVVVAEPLAALQAAAAAHRRGWGKKLVGVTGSNGKTTVRALLAAVLGRRQAVLATAGNLNNHIGVPLTLMGLREEHALAVVEMGASHAGEIAELAQIAAPDIGIVTQAGDAHLEGFGSRDGVARAKGELFAGLSADGVAVINADDSYAPSWRERAAHCRIVEFGRADAAAVRACDERLGPAGSRFRLCLPDDELEVRLPLPGAHNVSNALAAAAAAWALGLGAQEIADGLAAGVAVGGRLNLRPGRAGCTVADDSYNANPASLAAALDSVALRGGRRWLVLGDMAELGEQAAVLHAQAGDRARQCGFERLFACGELAAEAARAFGAGGAVYASRAELLAAVRPALGPELTVLVKGSRSARMEEVVAGLVEAH